MKRLQEVGLTVARLLTRLVYAIINHQTRLALALQRQAYASPLRLLAIATGSVFLAELVIMLVLSFWSPFSLFEDVLLDTFLLSFLILPLLYLFLFRPFTSNIRNLREAAQAEIRSLAQFPNENPNPVLRISKDGVILYANRSSQELLAAWSTSNGGQVPPVWLETILRLLKTGKFEEIEIDIDEKVFAVMCAPFPESGYVNLYGRDITERKRAEMELRVSEEKLKTLFKLLPAGLSILNEERRIVEVNPALGQILDISEERLVKGEYGQRTYLRADGTVMPLEEFPSVRVFKEQRTVENVEIGVIKENGATLWTNVSAVPLPFPDWRVVVITSDLTAHKQIDEALRESEERLKKAQEISHLGSWDLDLVNNVLTWSDEVYRIFGLKPQEFGASYEAFLEVVHPDDRAAVDAAYSGSLREGRDTYEIEHRIVRRSTGEIRIVHEKCEHFRDSYGQIVRSVGMVHDVTERKQAEEKLRKALEESQQRQTEISALLASAQAILHYREFEQSARFIFNVCKDLLGAKAGYVALLSKDGTETEIIFLDSGGQHCTVDRALPLPIRGLRAEVFQSHEAIYDNHFLTSKWVKYLPKGHSDIENVLFAPLRIDEKVVGLIGLVNKPGGFTEDDTRLASAFSELAAIALLNSQTLDSLENSEARFRSVAQSAGEGIITIDSQGKIVFWNRAATTMLGYTADEALGRPLTFIIPAEFRAAHRQGLERLVTGGAPRLIGKTVEMVGLRKDGCEFPLELSLSTWKVRGEVFFTGLLHDITERKQAEEALRRSHHELEQRVQERTTELAHINQTLEQRVKDRTHELATLLEASHNLASTLDMEQLLGLILDQLKRVLDCSGVLIFKVEGEMLVALAHRGPIPPQEVAELRFLLRDAPAYQPVILQRTPIIIPDVRGDTPLAQCYRESVGERLETTFAYVRSWLGVPLMVQEQVIGMLGLHHKNPNVYTAQHAELALAFATQAAVAIENARLYQQAQELAAMQERQRLARDLHDSVSQSLFSASLSAEVLPRLWERHPEEGRRCLAELHRLTRGALAEMRTLLLELRPTALVETALGDLLSQLAEAIAGRARLPVIQSIEPYPLLPPDVQVALYRIAQEALNNVVKHAGASRVEVSLRSISNPTGSGDLKNGVELRISDDGRGFEADNVPPVCLGLSIMRERAETIGASLKINSQPGQGTQVIIVWPGV